MAQEYRQDYKAMGKYLAGADMLKMVGDKIKEAEAAAIAIAPDHAPYGVGYINEFDTEVGIRPGKHPRACATLFNTSEHAIFVEFGGKETPRHRVLGRAIGAIS